MKRAGAMFILMLVSIAASILPAEKRGAGWKQPVHGEPVATFSIVAYDAKTGDLGIAVESKVFSVGSVVPWAGAGVGAVATQSFANTTYGPRGLAMLKLGMTAQQVLDALIANDPGRSRRFMGRTSVVAVIRIPRTVMQTSKARALAATLLRRSVCARGLR